MLTVVALRVLPHDAQRCWASRDGRIDRLSQPSSIERQPQLRVAIQVNDLPPAADYPVGTRLSLATPGPDALHQLYDDGKWRPVSKADLQVKY